MTLALLVPILGIAVGVGMWFVLRGIGAMDVPGADPGGGGGYRAPAASRWQESRGGSLRERIDALPAGCLIGVTVAAGLWVLGWVIVLIVGLSLLA